LVFSPGVPGWSCSKGAGAVRFWIPILSTLFAAIFIARLDPTPVGIVAACLMSVTGMDVAARLCE
jgi:hypothetical protein